MRVAILADIHGNLTALDAVRRDLRLQAPDIVICAEDVVDGGSSPDGVTGGSIADCGAE